MSLTVCITQDDQGKFSVGIEEADDSSADDLDDQQEAGSLAEALAMAKHLFENPPADSDESSEGATPDADDSGMSSAASSGASMPSASSANGSGAASGQSAQDIWNELAAQNQPSH